MGSDIAGVIVEVGENVSNYKIGDKVYGDLSNSRFGGFAEYVGTSEKNICIMAEQMPFDAAAAIPQAGMLAFQALHDFTEITEGMKILINGAGGGVGTYVVQMLKNHDVNLTGVDAEVKREMLLQLGYDEFVNYKKTNRSLRKYSKILNENGIYITIGGDMLKVIRIMLMSKHLENKYGRKFKCVQLHTNRNLPEINKLFEEGRLTSILCT